MLQRAMISTAVLVAVAGLFGCREKADPDKPATKEKQAEKAPAWESIEDGTPTGAGRTRLERIGVHCRQLEVLGKRKPLPYNSIESLGWKVSRQAGELVAAYEFARREKVSGEESDAAKLKAMEMPEGSWAKWPEGIRDLDRLAINAKALALAAGELNLEEVRTRLDSLKKAAGRCLPRPGAAAAGAGTPQK